MFHQIWFIVTQPKRNIWLRWLLLVSQFYEYFYYIGFELYPVFDQFWNIRLYKDHEKPDNPVCDFNTKCLGAGLSLTLILSLTFPYHHLLRMNPVWFEAVMRLLLHLPLRWITSYMEDESNNTDYPPHYRCLTFISACKSSLCFRYILLGV